MTFILTNITHKIKLIFTEIIKCCVQIKKIIVLSKERNSTQYLSLTPISNADEDKAYSNMIKFALSKDNIKNIAITGPYGSGKSSVLLTFQKHNPQWKYLNISLATFKDHLKNEDTNNKKIEIEIEAIEKSILQQLFYSVKQKDIPKSRLKRITSTNKRNLIALSTFLFILIFSFIIIFLPDITLLKPFPQIKIKITEYIHILTLFFSVLLFISLYFIVKYFGIIQELKLKFQDTEITLNNKTNESMLNTYLDEVLYFFERTNVNIIIFEDLDRFNNTEIFIKLRELNELINNSKQVNKHIVFIYAIKDDMFLDKDRSKFFDFIVPIIPVINPTNAYYLIRKSFINKDINKELDDRIDDKFLHQVSLFFDDLRLVTNIFNEFNLYNTKINSSNLDSNKLLALIIYKNYNPKDLSNLHSNTGEIYDLFKTTKAKAILETLENIDQKIHNLEVKLKELKKENITSIQELRKIYIYEIMKRFPIISKIKESYNNRVNEYSYSIELIANNKTIDYSNLEENDEYFETLAQSDLIEWSIKYNGNYTVEAKNKDDLKFSFKDIEKSIGDSISYEQRENNIKNKMTKMKDKLVESKQEIIFKKNKISQLTLKEIIEDNTNKTIFDCKKHSALLQFLVKEGYIDEHYPNYISHFIASVINLEERDYALNVLSSKNSKFDLKLKNIDKIISNYLPPRYFRHTSILNFDLLDFIIINRDLYIDHYDNLLDLISNQEDRSIQFIFEYLDRGENLFVFINQIVIKWNNFFEHILSSMAEDKVESYLLLILKFLEKENIPLLDTKNILQEYISEKLIFIDYIKNTYSTEQEILNFLEIIEPKFNYLECNNKDDVSLFNEICKNEYFIFNEKMILQIILLNNEDKEHDDVQKLFRSKPYGTIHELAPDYLKSQIDQSINHFFEEVYISSSKNLSETTNNSIKLINNEDLNNSHKEWLIENNEVKFSNLNIVKEKILWELIIINLRISPNWDSLISYFIHKEFIIDDTLINYINSQEAYESLGNMKIFDAVSVINNDDLGVNFESSLLISEKFNLNAYNSIILAHKYSYKNLDISELSNEKALILCQNTVLSFSDKNLERIRNKSNEVLVEFLSKNTEYLLEKVPSELDLTNEEFELILKSNKFSSQFKKKLVDKLDIELFSKSESIRLLVINLYNQLSVNIPIHLIDYYFENSISVSQKIALLTSQIKYLDKENIIKFFDLLGTPYSEIFTHNRQKLNFSAQHDKLTTELELKGYIHRKEIKKYKIAEPKIFFYLK